MGLWLVSICIVNNFVFLVLSIVMVVIGIFFGICIME